MKRLDYTQDPSPPPDLPASPPLAVLLALAFLWGPPPLVRPAAESPRAANPPPPRPRPRPPKPPRLLLKGDGESAF